MIRGNYWFNSKVSKVLSVWLCTHMHAHVSVLGDLIPAGDRWTLNPVPLLRGKAGGWGPPSQSYTVLEPNTPNTPRQYKKRLLPWRCSVSSRTPPGKKCQCCGCQWDLACAVFRVTKRIIWDEVVNHSCSYWTFFWVNLCVLLNLSSGKWFANLKTQSYYTGWKELIFYSCFTNLPEFLMWQK